MKTITIQIPDHMELDQDKFMQLLCKEQERKLPESWEELRVVSGCLLDVDGCFYEEEAISTDLASKTIWPTKELALASKAMSQLAQLRDYYNDGWVPDWGDGDKTKHGIYFCAGRATMVKLFTDQKFLAFKTEELRDHFLKHHKGLIEKAKPLL